MAKALVERASFAAGEVSPALYARRELAVHAIGVARCENMVVLLEGALTRRPGTRFVLPYKVESENAFAIRFRYQPQDGYLLVLNGGVMRVLKDGGFLESSPGVIYELAIPWTAADLPNLRYQQVDNAIYITCTGYQTRVLTRGASHITWTFTLYQPAGGPVDTQNLDTAITIRASGASGTGITLTGSGTAFTANDVGGVFRLDEPDLTAVPQWVPDEVLDSPWSLLSSAGLVRIGDMTSPGSAFDGNTNVNGGASASATAATAYLGLDFTTALAKPIAGAIVYGSNDVGYSFTGNPTITLTLYASQVAPANGTDGVKLGTVTFTDTNNESGNPRTIYSNDASTAWRYAWVYIKPAAPPSNVYFAELQFYRWTSATPTNLRRYNGRVYAALNDGNVGGNPPEHDVGDWLSGQFNVAWRFKHNTYGFARVTGFTSATVLTADVISLLPDSVVSGATYRWFPPAWSPGAGWPNRVASHDGRLLFGRNDRFWITRPSNINSLEVLNVTGDAADADSAITARLRPRKVELPWIEWFVSAGVVIVGLRDSERILRAPQLFDALTMDKLRAIPGSKEGSAAHDPADVDDGVIFIGRSRRRLHFADFDNLNEKMSAAEITKSARHIIAAGAATLAWQRDPNRVLWITCQDGSLRAVTFMPEDKVVAFHRHPLTNGFVEWVVSVPTADEKTDEVYFGVRRTINGATRRYVERLQEFFLPLNSELPTAAGAWFVDCALALANPTAAITGATKANPVVITAPGHTFANGAQVKITGVAGMIELNGLTFTVANKTATTFELSGVNGTAFGVYTGGGLASQMVTTISGLSHLALQTVRIFADGAQQGDAQVSAGGVVTLLQPANNVLVGLPIKYFVRSLPMDVETQAGASKGKAKRVNHVVVETVYSAGGTVAIHPGEIGMSGGKKEPIVGTGSLDYDAEVPLLTELKRLPVSAKSGPRCFIEIEGDNALPFTLAGMSPELEVDG